MIEKINFCKLIASITFTLGAAYILSSCTPNTPGTPEATSTDSTSMALNVQEIPIDAPKPPIDRRKEVADSLAREKSPFKNIVCCTDSQKMTQDLSCCCDQVLVAYVKMKQEKSKKEIGNLKLKDPYIKACKNTKLYRQRFEDADKPTADEQKKLEADY